MLWLSAITLSLLFSSAALSAPLALARSSSTHLHDTSFFENNSGFDMGNGVTRFTIPYAQPPLGPLRFANPQPVLSLHGHDLSKLPPSCYQSSNTLNGDNPISEDCLYSVYYVPTDAAKRVSLPIFVWIHGGSSIMGTASAPGLDGSSMVLAQNVIVVVVQYRLGLFGWLQTESTLDEIRGGAVGDSKVSGNQALKDVVMALDQVRAMSHLIGGSSSQVALMGQSSGATMIRSLLTTPQASGLFTHAVLVSDTADYGLADESDNSMVGEYALEQLHCSRCDVACARQASADDILQASLTAYSQVPLINPGIPSGAPYRPMIGHYVTGTIEKGAKSNVPVIMTTVANEAGALTSYAFTESPANAVNLTYVLGGGSTMPMSVALEYTFNAGRGPLLDSLNQVYPTLPISDGLRQKFETIVTDGLWRCAVQANAVELTSAGSKVWLAEWNVGTTYPSNINADYCNKDGHVCHEDDVYTIFGTAPDPSKAARLLSIEWQARLSSFVRTGKPNTADTISWSAIQSPSQLNMLSLGTQDDTSPTSVSTIQASQHPQTCQAIWGNIVKFDWQLYESA